MLFATQFGAFAGTVISYFLFLKKAPVPPNLPINFSVNLRYPSQRKAVIPSVGRTQKERNPFLSEKTPTTFLSMFSWHPKLKLTSCFWYKSTLAFLVDTLSIWSLKSFVQDKLSTLNTTKTLTWPTREAEREKFRGYLATFSIIVFFSPLDMFFKTLSRYSTFLMRPQLEHKSRKSILNIFKYLVDTFPNFLSRHEHNFS